MKASSKATAAGLPAGWNAKKKLTHTHTRTRARETERDGEREGGTRTSSAWKERNGGNKCMTKCK